MNILIFRHLDRAFNKLAMGITELYYYIFYKFYKLLDAFESTRNGAKYKAAICVGMLELSLYFSFVNYRDVALDRNSDIGPVSIIAFALIIVSKLIAINIDSWGRYINRFDEWPTLKNKTGGWVVLFMTVIIIGNFIYSSYLFSPLRGPSNARF
jgi:hypothetical protein